MTNDQVHCYMNFLYIFVKDVLDFFFFFFFLMKKRGVGATIRGLPPRHDLLETPPQGNVRLSHSYCDRGATNLILTPQESQQMRRNAC